MPSCLSRKELRTILRGKQGNNCCYCGVLMTDAPQFGAKRCDIPKTAETLEHLHRIIDGGTNNRDNLALSCFDCNTGRWSVDWFTYKCYRMGELWT